MKQVTAVTVAVLGLVGFLASDAVAAEKFRKLTGSQSAPRWQAWKSRTKHIGATCMSGAEL
jgi:hypothetical protein